MAQAERDLEHARESREWGRHESACFAAQQAAEKAVKAVHLHSGRETWGHVVAKLLDALELEVDVTLIEKAKVLDNFYVPSRNPNGHPEGAPFEHYGPNQSRDAIRHANDIIEFCRARMA